MPVRACSGERSARALSLMDARRSPRASAPSNRSKLRIAPEFRIGEHLPSSGSRISAVLILSGQHAYPLPRLGPNILMQALFWLAITPCPKNDGYSKSNLCWRCPGQKLVVTTAHSVLQHYRRRRGPKPDRRRALELLAASPEGCTEALMFANGFTAELPVELVRAGLASAHAERMVAGGKSCLRTPRWKSPQSSCATAKL